MPLPMGGTEFNNWSMRIISAAQVPGLTIESARFALSEMLLHVKPTQSFESDAYFIHSLRKGAVNQVAYAIFKEIKDKRDAEIAVEKQKELMKSAIESAETTQKGREQNLNGQKVLANPKV